ncbi:MAG: Lon protease family protein [Candidatus Promineifilaceae bacterium]
MSGLDFQTTDDLEDLTGLLGQPRAEAALRFGMGIARDGYNIFALGPNGTGKRTIIRRAFAARAAAQPVPDDWCYVNNFQDYHKPKAIRLPAGQGTELRDDMNRLIAGLGTVLSSAFESEEYQARRQTITDEFEELQSHSFQALQEKAEEKNMTLLRTPSGLVFAPVREGQVLSPDELQELSLDERQQLEKDVETLQGELQKAVQQMPAWQRETQQKLRELNHEIARFAVGGLITELREKYSDYDDVVAYLDAVQNDIVENAQNFLARGGEEEDGQSPVQMITGSQNGESPLARRYRVNLLVDNSRLEGAPVIYEDNPTYQNLVGRIEHRAQMGALLTDFNLIKPGALHLANGGYLILNARELLTQAYAYEALKRALQAGEIRIESVGQMLSLVSTISLEPTPIPLKLKVALYGDPFLYYMLYEADPEFAELFKVEADFSDRMERSGENQALYARLIAGMVRREELPPFDRGAVARIIEHASRQVEDTRKISMQTESLRDLLHQAAYWAAEDGHDPVGAADVQRAIDAAIYRADSVREHMQEAVDRDIVLLDTRGEQVGQVNALSVIMLGNFEFGRPSRITARVRYGKGDVIDIEREVDLGGPLHSKGVLILSGYLGARYAFDNPFSLTATLVFEQSYGGIDGDSASSAELYALLSAIAEVPIKQSFAVTGSVNQYGMVQAIGGVNEKIEGFFDTCRARGLTGEQGVLIPAANVQHLMLRQDVVEAVKAGQFHIHAVATIDEGIEILTGIPAGEADEDGNYPEDSINYLVLQRFEELAEKEREREHDHESDGEDEEGSA